MLAALALLTTCLAPQSPSGVVINEVNYDDSGSDDFEFVEIYNGGGAPVDISNWTLNGIDGTTAGNGTFTFPPGTILNPGEFYVVGQSAVANVNAPLGGLGLENGADGVFLEDAAFVVQDGVIWEFADWTNPVPTWIEGEGLFGSIQGHEHPTGTLDSSFGRAIDGVDTDDNGCDFRPMRPTPGSLNLLAQTTPLPYANDFDGPVTTTVAADFAYSFVPGNVQDPAALQVAIISGIPSPTVAIPASPQGGNVALWHDPTGGGNANWLQNFTQADYLMESWVYFTGPNANMDADDGEVWVMGVRGHSDSFGEFHDIGGFWSLISCGGVGSTATQPGHTGIAWLCQRTANICNLYLMDFNNGGTDYTILAGPVAIQTGVNDGWQRVRICAEGSNVVANFGGTYGCDDGQRFTATTTTTCANGAYITFRECITDNDNMLPLITDALVVTGCSGASSALVGTGSPSSVGVPSIAASGPPVIGDLGFAVQGSGMVPGSNPFCGIIADTNQPLPGVQIPGAQAGALLYASPTVVSIGFADASGNVSFALPINCLPSLVGFPVTTQLFDWDVNLSNPLPLATSPGLTLTLGY